MFDLTSVVLTSTGAGLAIIFGVWLLVRTKIGAGRANLEQGDSQSARSNMQASDWINAAVNIVLGTLLGIAIVGFGQLITTGHWLIAILILILFAGLWLFDGLIEGLAEKIFPSGVRPARNSAKRRRAPLPRFLSLPVGILLGVALALLGFGDKLLAMI